MEKLSYIHNNPASKKWMLAASAIDYVYSSARFYETGEQSIYYVTHYMEWESVMVINEASKR